MDLTKRIGYGLIFFIFTIEFKAHAQFNLPPIDPPCTPHCIEPPDLGGGNFAMDTIVFGKLSPAGFALGERAVFHIKYTASHPVRISLIGHGILGCRGTIYREVAHNRLLPAATGSIINKEIGCGEKSDFDSLEIKFTGQDNAIKFRKMIGYDALWIDNKIDDIFPHLLPYNEEQDSLEHITMEVGDTISVIFDYNTHYRKRVEINVQPLIRSSSAPEPWDVPMYVEEPYLDSYPGPSSITFSNLIIQEPARIEGFKFIMKAAYTEVVLADTIYTEKIFSVGGVSSINHPSILRRGKSGEVGVRMELYPETLGGQPLDVRGRRLERK